MTNHQPTQDFDLPLIEKEDIDQEVELLKLQGIANPSRKLIEKKLSRGLLITSFDSEILSAKPMPWEINNEVPEEVITKLINFAIRQSEVISEMVLSFLDEPDEEKIPIILKELHIRKEAKTKTSSVSTLILNTLKKAPATREQLYQLGRENLTSERPEANIRQSIRRLLKTQAIQENENVYSLTN